MVRVSVDNLAGAWLALLKARGIDYLFANAGTDFAPLIEALAAAGEKGIAMPEPVAVGHELVAVGVAHGYWLASGRMQAVMVHVNVGMANALSGLFNAFSDRVPMLFTAGRTPLTEHGLPGSRDLPIHWGQDLVEQAGILAEATRWEGELLYPEHLESLVDRALAVATSPPAGPVYMELPREALARPLQGFAFSADPTLRAASPPAPDPATIAKAARLLQRAERPLLIASRESGGGRDFGHLVRFAEKLAVPVVHYWPSRLSFPTDHPLHAGFALEPWLEQADLVLVLDTLVPWMPGRQEPRPGVPVIAIGPDPLFAEVPLRGHRADLAIAADTALALAALETELAGWIAEKSADLDARRRRIAGRTRQMRDALIAAARADRGMPIGQAHLSVCLDAALPEDAVVVNELGCLPAVMNLRQPGSYFGHAPAGSLGLGLPAALGIKLARPESTVVCTLGDGSYIFANPTACHHLAAVRDLSVLTIVCDNGGWNAVRRATRNLYPEGAAARADRMPLTSLEPSPAYEKIVAASGGHGERVEDPAALPEAIARALRIVREERRQAVLNLAIRIEP